MKENLIKDITPSVRCVIWKGANRLINTQN